MLRGAFVFFIIMRLFAPFNFLHSTNKIGYFVTSFRFTTRRRRKYECSMMPFSHTSDNLLSLTKQQKHHALKHNSVKTTSTRGTKPLRQLPIRFVNGRTYFTQDSSFIFNSTEGYSSCKVIDVLHDSIQVLQANNVPEPTLSSCNLLSQALSLNYNNGFSYLLSILDNKTNIKQLSQRCLTQEEATNYEVMLKRRLEHEPIQYILGEWDFYDFTIKCRAPILCPRPETEELVDWVRQCIVDRIQHQQQQQQKEQRRIRILDVGCGSGVIGLALARLFPTIVDVVAIDISLDAVNLSMENAELLQINNDINGSSRYQAICCSAKNFTNQQQQQQQTHYFEFDFVVSNPPYIPPLDMLTLTRDVLQYESYEALCGDGPDGLDVIRDIVERLPEWTNTNNNNNNAGHLFLEVDTSHPSIIEKWLQKTSDDTTSTTNLPAFFVESRKDCSGKDRFVKLQPNPSFAYHDEKKKRTEHIVIS